MNEIARKKRELSRQAKILAVTGVLTAGLIAVLCSVTSYAASVTVDLGAGNAGAQFGVLEALLVVTLLALAPTLLIMMTSFSPDRSLCSPFCAMPWVLSSRRPARC